LRIRAYGSGVLSLLAPISWTTIFTTNPPALPFEFTDFEVTVPHKFYRARQP
jgi:hypothetical protein